VKGLLSGNANVAMMSDFEETREFCLVPYQVTFASLNKVKFYRDFNLGQYSNIISYFEKEAQLTISKLKESLLFRKGIIEKVTSDINKSDQIIYFEILLAPETTRTSFIELLGYLNDNL